jgi:hypothetical protein
MALARSWPEIVRYTTPSPLDGTTGQVEGAVPAGDSAFTEAL